MAASSHSTANARSPSPISAPPLPQTPGPLATRLATLYQTALQHTLRTCSYPAFAACFPTPARHKPAVLQSLWSQVVGKIESKATEEFEGILIERDVVGGLNALERVMEVARKERASGREAPLAPHTLPPSQLFLAHLTPYLASARIELDDKLQKAQTRNKELAEGIRVQKEEVENIVAGLEAVIGDLERANAVLGEWTEAGGVRNDVMEMDDEVKVVANDRVRTAKL